MKFLDDKIYIFENFLGKNLCNHYSKFIEDIGPQPHVLPFLNHKFELNLQIDQIQTQNWHVNSYGPLHIHDRNGRENNKYNSLLYLNDDFQGGEFITENGFKYKPKQGALTLFNGHAIKHGTSKVFSKDRKTLIFWWKQV
jgi:hypothetical protein